jgi:ankyrin repeat protein
MRILTGILVILSFVFFISCGKSDKEITTKDKKTDDVVKTEQKTAEKISPDAFWKAIEDGDAAVLKGYLEKDPSLVSLKTTDGIDETALAKTAFTGKTEIVKLLLQYKADPNVHDAYGIAALHGAARTNKAEVIEAIVNNKGDVNIKKDGTGDTPLHYAAEYNSMEAAQMLIKLGADKTVKNDAGKTPYEVAKEKKSDKVIDLLK